ncbi:MAG: M6 family metalloprotease domain-containing protein [Candidatus Cloacimonetes bacterium]|nr:M6 family metalloprotease domain-containing protein [Candidatus Cloacimonadota bacterium]
MKRILITTILGLLCLWLIAAPHSYLSIEVEQPDGNKIKIFASGDEFHNWLHDKENYTIIKDDAGYYVYARQDNEHLAPTSLIVGKDHPSKLQLPKGLNLSKRLIQEKYDRLANMRDYSNAKSPHEGNFNNLVVFIRFSDSPEFSYPISYYDSIFNDNAPDANSMKNYFLAASYDMLEVDSFFFPQPNGQVIVSYVDSHPRGYYSPQSISNPIGYNANDDWARTEREHALLANASWYVADLIPSDINVDGDDDGYVDNVCFIIQGSPDGWAELLWPHRWVLYNEVAIIQNARVWDFNFQLETSLGSSGASVLSHEMFHSLGAPDLYRYVDNTIAPIGSWDLMASNTNPPQHMSAWMKHRYGQWLPEPSVISQSGNYTLYPVAGSSTNNIYLVNSWLDNEQYVLEYRKPHGIYDNTLPGEGLLVYRLNDSYEGNADGPPDELYIYRPGATDNYTQGNLSQAAMSEQSGRTFMNESTSPSGFGTNRNPGGLYIYNVGAAGNSITFDIRFTDIHLSHPRGEETWFSGASKTITWVSRNPNGSVKIEFSSNGGDSWQTITSSAPNNGSYLWESIPVLNSDNCLIKISQNFSSNWDTSMKPFTIISGIAVPTLLDPPNMAQETPTNPTFSWNTVPGATGYNFQLSDNPEFSATTINILNHPHNHYHASGLSPLSTYYWRVSGQSEIGSSVFSEIYQFTTGTISETPHIPQLSYPPNYSTNQPRNTELMWQASNLAEEYRVQLSSDPYFVNIIFERDNLVQNNVITPLLSAYTSFYWRVSAKNSYASSNFSSSFRFTTGDWSADEDELNQVPITSLQQNIPNPFNPTTTISFSVENPTQLASLKIYNSKGQLVRNLYQGIPGINKLSVYWDGKDNAGNDLSSGIYLYRLESSSNVLTRKMLLSK